MLSELYEEVKEITKNFTMYPEGMILEKPMRIKVFRIILGLGQRKFAELLGTNQSRISLIERGKKPESKEEKAYFEILKKTKIDVTQIDENDEMRIKRRGIFEGEYARKMAERSSGSIKAAKAKKPTPQEQKIIEFLENKNIIYERNGHFNLKGFNIVCDFVIPNVNKPEKIIEAKELHTKYRKKGSMFELSYKAIKLKEKYPKTILIAIIDGELTNSEKRILINEFNYCVNFDKINDIKW